MSNKKSIFIQPQVHNYITVIGDNKLLFVGKTAQLLGLKIKEEYFCKLIQIRQLRLKPAHVIFPLEIIFFLEDNGPKGMTLEEKLPWLLGLKIYENNLTANPKIAEKRSDQDEK